VRRLVQKTLAASELERPEVAARRAGWRAARPFIDPERLVFIHESGVNTKMTSWACSGFCDMLT
jgi:hypothetical protein